MSRAQNDYLFLELPREEPTKRNFSVRTANFGEIYQATEPARIGDQASRCIACGNPYCEWKCPVHNYIPNWLELLAEDRIMEAADLCHATNALPEMCGRICPQDRLCEGACTLNSDYGAVTIGQAEKYIVDTAIQRGWAPDLSGVAQLPYSVGIVGAGPAGLSCADRLRRFGIEAVVYDRYPRIGGLLTFGIPEFKLEKQVVERRRAILEDMGVRFELGVDVGADVQAEELLQRHQALFVATGAYDGVDIGLPGQDARGVHRALPYLIANTDHIHRIGWGREDYVNLAGEQVLVLGRRRHRHGLQPHGGAAERRLGDLRVPQGRGQHAGLGARGEPLPRGGGAVPLPRAAHLDRGAGRQGGGGALRAHRAGRGPTPAAAGAWRRCPIRSSSCPPPPSSPPLASTPRRRHGWTAWACAPTWTAGCCWAATPARETCPGRPPTRRSSAAATWAGAPTWWSRPWPTAWAPPSRS